MSEQWDYKNEFTKFINEFQKKDREIKLALTIIRLRKFVPCDYSMFTTESRDEWRSYEALFKIVESGVYADNLPLEVILRSSLLSNAVINLPILKFSSAISWILDLDDYLDTIYDLYSYVSQLCGSEGGIATFTVESQIFLDEVFEMDEKEQDNVKIEKIMELIEKIKGSLLELFDKGKFGKNDVKRVLRRIWRLNAHFEVPNIPFAPECPVVA